MYLDDALSPEELAEALEERRALAREQRDIAGAYAWAKEHARGPWSYLAEPQESACLLDTSAHEKRRDQKMQNPEYRREYDSADWPEWPEDDVSGYGRRTDNI